MLSVIMSTVAAPSLIMPCVICHIAVLIIITLDLSYSDTENDTRHET
jgi:hypothetical protein